MLAVIETGGKQYLVAPDKKIKIEKIKAEPEAVFDFDKVLLVADEEKVKLGKPYLEGVKVSAKVVRHGRAEKVIVFKYRAKKRQHTKRGHKQPFTEVQIISIK